MKINYLLWRNGEKYFMAGINTSLTGPPGSGKSTQGRVLAKKYRIPHISTGELLRDEIETETVAGQVAKPYIEKGELVPVDITASVVRDRLLKPDCRRGFVIDGYPRRLDDVGYFEQILEETGIKNYLFIGIWIDFQESLRRLLSRGRPDDTRDIIKYRYEVYCRETIPVIEFYKNKDRYLEISGFGSFREVTQRLSEAVDAAAEKAEMQPHGMY
jgi:adenylate kinase